MRCIYCDKEKKRESLSSLFGKEDLLCTECRKKLPLDRKILHMEGFDVETFYRYEGFFSSLLLQYKECYDEALKDVFLYDLKDYIALRYHGYALAYVPGSIKKTKERGFLPLRGIFSSLGMREVKGLSLKEERIQEGKSREERMKMSANILYEGPKEKKVLIVDDVITTGSSVLGMYRALHPFTKKLRVLCLSRAGEKENAFK